jgi:outer membrane protein TolC
MDIGTLAQLSVEQDQSQVAQNEANVITAESTLDSDENALKNLITDDFKQWQSVNLVPSEPLTADKQEYDLQDSWNKGMTLRPDLLQAQITLEQQGIQLKFDRNQLFPELNLTGSYGYNGGGAVYNDVFAQYRNQDSPFYTYGANLSIPLANLQPRNAYKADKVTERQDLLKLKQIEQNILVEIDNAVKQAQSDYESVQATRQSRIYAEAALDAEQKTYAVGKATTFEVLTYQNNLTTARGQEIRALANYEEALATLAQQEGSTLQRRNIDLVVQ